MWPKIRKTAWEYKGPVHTGIESTQGTAAIWCMNEEYFKDGHDDFKYCQFLLLSIFDWKFFFWYVVEFVVNLFGDLKVTFYKVTAFLLQFNLIFHAVLLV